MSSQPIYNVNLSYEENYQQGPFGSFATVTSQLTPLQPTTTFLNLPVNTPFGMAAGPLLNSKFTKAAFLHGFDICVYKTVRAVSQAAHAGVNILPVKVDGKLGLKSDKIQVIDQYDSSNLTITNSFGVPSFAPDIWQPDMAKAVREAGTGQILIGAFQGTHGHSKTIEDDYALAARLVNETGTPILEANFSCPNEGISDLICFDINTVERIVNAIKTAVPDKPLLIKMAYFADQTLLIELIKRVGHLVDGICAINTIPARAVDADGNPALGKQRVESGVCGDAIRWAGLEMTERLANLRQELDLKFAIVAMGGLSSAAAYQAYIKAGADAGMSATAAMWNPNLAIEIKELIKEPDWLNIPLELDDPARDMDGARELKKEQNLIHSKHFKPGVYHESIEGNWVDIDIDVALSQTKIEEISILNPEELMPDVVENITEISNRILDANSPYVDAIAGATVQSESVKSLVTKVMLQASREAIIAEGGDPDLISTDIVIVGSGGAGLAAAIEATDHGAKVMIVEQMSVIGGNTNKASAGINAAESKFQQLKGIKDSKELFYQETIKAGKNKNNPELLDFFVEHAPAAIDWLDTKNISLSDLTTTGGMSVDRTHRPASKQAIGGFLISGLLKQINQREIDIMLNTKVVSIIQNEQHQVSAVKIEDEEHNINTIECKAVIVATGGFSANHEMVVQYQPELASFVTTNHQGANGSGIKLLTQIGADTVDMPEIQIHPTVEQSTAYLISESIRGGGAILVSQAGQRFCNELDTRDKVSAAIINLPEHYAYLIFDQQVRDNNKDIEQYIAKRLVTKARSIDELAHQLAMDSNNLTKTLASYNSFVNNQQDLDFGRSTAMRYQLNQTPFYAIKIAPGIHHTMGGIKINPKTEVLTKDNQIIRGVYAAGEVTGGIHGANRIGGNAIADIIIFGIQAGKNAAEFIKQTTDD